MNNWQGTGEAGVREPMSKDKYCEEIGTELIDAVVTASCGYFGCIEPSQVLVYDRHRRNWGTYNHRYRVIELKRCVLGVLVHELAHHIVRTMYPEVPLRAHHEDRFYSVLQELHVMWG